MALPQPTPVTRGDPSAGAGPSTGQGAVRPAAGAAPAATTAAGGPHFGRSMSRREQLLETAATARDSTPPRASGSFDDSDSESVSISEPPSPTPPWMQQQQQQQQSGSSAGAMQYRSNPSYMLPESPASAGTTPTLPAPRYIPPPPPAAPAWALDTSDEPPLVLVLPPDSGVTSRYETGAGVPPSGPVVPDWTTRRPYMTGAHLGASAPSRGGSSAASAPARAGGKALQEHAPALQELLLLDDVLYAMVGIDGRFIRATSTPDGAVRFVLEGDADPPLSELVRRILVLCSDAASVHRFAEQRSSHSWGLTANACAAAMRTLLADWRSLAVQLEHQLRCGRLSLQATWFYVQPAAGALRLLATVAAAVGAPSMRGAPLLNALMASASAAAGDVQASEVLHQLLAAAAVPYCTALGKWIHEGVVDDPWGEFLIQEAPQLSKESLAEDYTSTYWTERYTLRAATPPPFLTAAQASRVLTTGRYLNAIRECGGLPATPPSAAAGQLVYKPRSNALGERIDAAFAFASGELLRFLSGQHALGARLQSLKHYFLLDHGDFLVHFLDSACDELAKPSTDISLPKLQGLLDGALKQSIAAGDEYHDDLVCGLERSGIIAQLLSIYAVSEDAAGGPASVAAGEYAAGDGAAPAGPDQAALAALGAVPPAGGAVPERALTGMETFTLDYRVAWPLSLVISRKALTKYQLVFRHLFHCRHVERQLGATWQLHQATRRIAGPAGPLGRAYCLCQRMLHFLQNFMYYITVEVIEPNWAVMDEAMRRASTLDDVIEAHDRFLDACMKEGMLFWPKILKRLERIKSICLRFAATTGAFAATIAPPGSPPGSPPPPRYGRRSSSSGAANIAAPGLQPVLLSPSNSIAGGGAAYGVGADRASGFGRKTRSVEQEEVLNMRTAASEPGFVAAMRALEAQFDTQLRELRAALNASSHLEPNLSSLAFRLAE